MPRDAETNDALLRLQDTLFFYWIGLHDQREEGTFEWMDGSALGEYELWAPGQPTGRFPWNIADCVTLRVNKWMAVPCNLNHHFICQASPASCPKGYTLLREICYKIYKISKTFSEATKICDNDGGTLAMPRDHRAHADMQKWQNFPRSYWIGLHSQRGEEKFEWVDGSALGRVNLWFPGEPNESTQHDVCVALERNKWKDLPCTVSNHFICQSTGLRRT
ncbi:snaclec coagulation factor IX-binding protein subunit A-like [Branchiostoma floridae x Branchiostoma belcheri]